MKFDVWTGKWLQCLDVQYYYKYRYKKIPQKIRYDTYGIFYIPVNFAFNYLPHHSQGSTTQVKKRVKKKKKKNKVTKNLLRGDSNPDSPNTLELKMIDFFSFRVELNL